MAPDDAPCGSALERGGRAAARGAEGADPDQDLGDHRPARRSGSHPARGGERSEGSLDRGAAQAHSGRDQTRVAQLRHQTGLLRQFDAGFDQRRLHGTFSGGGARGRCAGRPARHEFPDGGRRADPGADRRRLRRRRRGGHAAGRRAPHDRQQQQDRDQLGRRAGEAADSRDGPEADRGREDQRSSHRQRLYRGERAGHRERRGRAVPRADPAARQRRSGGWRSRLRRRLSRQTDHHLRERRVRRDRRSRRGRRIWGRGRAGHSDRPDRRIRPAGGGRGALQRGGRRLQRGAAQRGAGGHHPRGDPARHRTRGPEGAASARSDPSASSSSATFATRRNRRAGSSMSACTAAPSTSTAMRSRTTTGGSAASIPRRRAKRRRPRRGRVRASRASAAAAPPASAAFSRRSRAPR